MSAGEGDKRKVSTDALETLGTIITESEKRDAIHLAVEPIIAGERLCPAGHVGIGADGKAYHHKVKHLGIVDPFLTEYVESGERFWLVVYPRQIHSLRHVWTHPDFPDEPSFDSSVVKSIAWVEDYAVSIGLDRDELMDAADDWVTSKRNDGWGDYLVKGGDLEGVSTDSEFWRHYEIIRGVKLGDEVKTNFFSCSC